ncbi:hypothetical protein DIPPA_01172 [Diplonema papillatum]|nr:hypothetical protein DIPPA_01172 [Diplonema papillatum]
MSCLQRVTELLPSSDDDDPPVGKQPAQRAVVPPCAQSDGDDESEATVFRAGRAGGGGGVPRRRPEKDAAPLQGGGSSRRKRKQAAKADVFRGCVVAIVVGGKALGPVRARAMAGVLQGNGAEIAANLQKATHIVTAYASRFRLQTALGFDVPPAATVCTPEWVSRSLQSNILSATDTLPTEPATDYPQLALPAVQPSVDVRPPQGPADADATAGFIPVFFPEKSAAGSSSSPPASPARKRQSRGPAAAPAGVRTLDHYFSAAAKPTDRRESPPTRDQTAFQGAASARPATGGSRLLGQAAHETTSTGEPHAAMHAWLSDARSDGSPERHPWGKAAAVESGDRPTTSTGDPHAAMHTWLGDASDGSPERRPLGQAAHPTTSTGEPHAAALAWRSAARNGSPERHPMGHATHPTTSTRGFSTTGGDRPSSPDGPRADSAELFGGSQDSCSSGGARELVALRAGGQENPWAAAKADGPAPDADGAARLSPRSPQKRGTVRKRAEATSLADFFGEAVVAEVSRDLQPDGKTNPNKHPLGFGDFADAESTTTSPPHDPADTPPRSPTTGDRPPKNPFTVDIKMNPDLVSWLEGQQVAHYPSRKPAGWACQKGTETAADKDAQPNQKLLRELGQLVDTYDRIGDTWRKYSTGKAIGIIKRWGGEIRSAAELRGVRGIGQRTLDKIQQILSTGTCDRMQELQASPEVQAFTKLGRIWGVGPATASKLYHQKSISTIAELQRQSAADPTLLNSQQKIGLRYYDELQERIPRLEAAHIKKVVTDVALALNPNLHVEVCGSYRRGKPTCGDVDILICHKAEKTTRKGLLMQLIRRLQDIGFLTDDLVKTFRGGKDNESGHEHSYFGIGLVPTCKDTGTSCPFTHLDAISTQHMLATDKPSPDLLRYTHIHRRIDIKIYPKETYAFALLYFTGSDYFNRSMRLYCQKKGMSLSDKSLLPVVRVNKTKVHEGQPIPCETEEEIFKAIGLAYKTPQERDV